MTSEFPKSCKILLALQHSLIGKCKEAGRPSWGRILTFWLPSLPLCPPPLIFIFYQCITAWHFPKHDMTCWFPAPCLLPGMFFCIGHLTNVYSSLKKLSTQIHSYASTPCPLPESSPISSALHLVHSSITAQIVLYHNYVWMCLSSLLDSEYLMGQGWDLFVFPSWLLGRLSLTHRPLTMFTKRHSETF